MGSPLLEEIQERIMRKRVEKHFKLYPEMDIAQLDEGSPRIAPKKLGGESKRFTLKGKAVYLEKVQDRLFCTLGDGNGLVAVEMENMQMNIEIKQGQLLCLVARLKCAPDGRFFCEARGITLLKEDDPRLKELKKLPEGRSPGKQGRRACRNYWEKAVPVSWARLRMVYKLAFLIPALYLVLEPQLFHRYTLGFLGPTLGMLGFILVFLTGRQVIKEYGVEISPPAG